MPNRYKLDALARGANKKIQFCSTKNLFNEEIITT